MIEKKETCPRCKRQTLEFLPKGFLGQDSYYCPDCEPTEDSCGLRVPAYFTPEYIQMKKMMEPPKVVGKPIIVIQPTLF